jgi:hypothetical protein
MEQASPRMPQVGQHVVWHSPVAVPHDALVTAVHTPTCINIVLCADEGQTDQYGRQIARHTSLSHKSANEAHGNYWRFVDEEPNPVKRPLAV